MPIESRELIIKARVENVAPPATGSKPEQQRLTDHDLQKIVNRCVEEVMSIIKRQKEK
jgi:hypothetical protein